MERNDETSSQDLDENNAAIPPSEGVPSEQDAAEDLPGVPDEAREDE